MRVLSLGTFDTPHFGHFALFKRCKELAGKPEDVYIAVNSDEFVEKFKGKKPLMSQSERINAIRNTCSDVGWVIQNNQEDKGGVEHILRERRPRYIVIGNDYLNKDYLGQLGITMGLLQELDISIVFVPYTPGISSSMIRKELCNQK